MRKCFFASSLFGATRCSALLIFNGALSSPTFIRHSKEWIRQATRSSNCQTWPIRIASSPSTGSAINHYHQLQMSYVADSSEYGSSDYDGNDGRDDSDADSDAKSVAGVRGFNEFADVPSIEELPVPMSKNSGSRFVAFVWDKDLDAIRVTTKGGKRKTREELHDERSEKIEDHILWARKANLYNETFNNNSVADVVWSYPL